MTSQYDSEALQAMEERFVNVLMVQLVVCDRKVTNIYLYILRCKL